MEQQTDSISKSVQNQNEGNVGNSEVTIPSPVITFWENSLTICKIDCIC